MKPKVIKTLDLHSLYFDLLLVELQEAVGKYPADFYDVSGLTLEAKKRREHLSEEDVAKNKAKAQTFANGASSGAGFDINCDIPRRESLPPPPRPDFSWEDYLQAAEVPRLGREIVCKESSKAYRATLAMVSCISHDDDGTLDRRCGAKMVIRRCPLVA
jgi:hypothetical protein